MKPINKLVLRALCIAAVMPALAVAAQDGQAPAVVGNTVHGSGDEGDFYTYYAPNGTAVSRAKDGDVSRGGWAIQSGNLCVEFPGETQSCYRVEVTGNSVTMTDISSGDSFHDDLIGGNPQRL